MAPVKRIKGRPARGAGDVGKERLVEAARTILRRHRPPAISRKDVAEAAGVTPALVSYYFPDKHSLVTAATGPLIGERLVVLFGIIEGEDARVDKLRKIVALFVGLNAAEAHLIDYAIDAYDSDGADASLRSMVTVAYERLVAFYRDGVEAGAWRPLDPDLFLLALWGMCRHVRMRPGADLPDPDPGDGRRQVDMITDLTLNGLAARS